MERGNKLSADSSPKLLDSLLANAKELTVTGFDTTTPFDGEAFAAASKEAPVGVGVVSLTTGTSYGIALIRGMSPDGTVQGIQVMIGKTPLKAGNYLKLTLVNARGMIHVEPGWRE